MGIYRGAGGTGDAVNDASSEAVLTVEARDAAVAAKNAAEAAQVAAELAETNAETAETNAETAKTAAETAQTAAETAQTAAETAETNAETAAANAAASAVTAGGYADDAHSYQLSAASSASTATTQAGLASASASAAATSESNAATSETNAAISEANAATIYDNFDDRYLGAKSSNPTVDNDGNTLITGALYFNTVVPEMRAWTGSTWQPLSAGGSVVSSFNTRNGDVTLSSSDVTTALTYTPLAPSAIGSTVQAYDAQLADIAGLTPADNSFIVGNGTNFVAETASTARTSLGVTATGADTTYAYRANNLSDLASASTARTNLGLGTAATTDSTAYATAAQGATADTAYADRLKWDGGSTGLVAATGRTSLGVTATGSDTTYAYRANNLSDLASASTARTNLGLGTAATTAATDYATAAQGTKADNALTAANPSYTGTLTGGTGVVNLGSGQVYKTAGGLVGLGTTSPSYKLHVVGDYIAQTGGSTITSIFGYDGASGSLLGTITNHYLRFITNNTEQFRITAAGLTQFNSGYGSVATAYGCRAWVNFNGSGTVAIRGSGNVSSITDNGTGDYTVNFSANMPDTNYATVASGLPGGGSGNKGPYPSTASVGSVRVYTYDGTGALVDVSTVNVAIFR